MTVEEYGVTAAVVFGVAAVAYIVYRIRASRNKPASSDSGSRPDKGGKPLPK